MMIRTLLASVGLAAITLTAAVGLQAGDYVADGNRPPPRIAVDYAGLDLTTVAGVSLLEQRINTAIEDVCPSDWPPGARGYSGTRDCRERAVRGVEPQVQDAVSRAWADAPLGSHAYDERMAAHYDTSDYPPGYDPSPDPLPPARSAYGAQRPPLPAAKAPLPGGRLVRRTVTTTTVVTTTHRGPPEPATVSSSAVKRVRHAPARPRYGRRPAVPGSWLPSVAWRAIEHATVRAFATGRLVRWHVRDRDGIDRDGHVTVGATRWIGGCACRDVQAVKYASGRRIVVAKGRRCRLPGGTLTG